MAKRPRKVRVDFRKNRQPRARRTNWTRSFRQDEAGDAAAPARESIRPKGEMSRRRTILVDPDALTAADWAQPVEPGWLAGRVLSISGIMASVEAADGRVLTCAVSRVLRTIAIEERNALAPGDRVHFRMTDVAASGSNIGEPQGMIERVEPRRGIFTRAYRGREQVIAANVDQLLIVTAMIDPPLKPNLIDRFIVAAEKGGIRPILCLNKADLVDVSIFQPYIGLYSQIGYEVLVLSAETGLGVGRLRSALAGRQTVLAGQSGVGKSSLLNAVESGLGLRVNTISQATMHGRHTTTTAQLFKLAIGGWVLDTPGIRQFELSAVIPEELEGYFVEMRAYVPYCRFPNCTHTHESHCAVKEAVESGEIDNGRYQRYINLFNGEQEARE